MTRSVRFAEEGGQELVVHEQPEKSREAPTSFAMICPNCGSREIEQHDASGASVCTECGVVVEENAIVSSIEFVEGAGGASSMVGQFVSATSSKAYTGSGGGRGGRYGFSRASRETTLANGRRRIQDVASRLRLGSHYVDAAHRLFTIAVEKNFVQGRRTTHVVAACLYIACRQEKSQHMLIDFSDALQVNVYVLGTCFLKFRRLLGLKLEIIDPALFVYRFAAHLDLDDKANAVALTALRLVGRMKRDWIVAGRRPAGICAAALLIAARAHGFSRHHQDVTKILRVCGMTVTTRVKEFEHTQSAMLTLEQFNTMELENEADPPVFTRNRIREVRVLRVLITSEPSPNDLCRFFLHHVRLVPRPSKRTMLNCSRADFWMIHVKANVRPSGDDRRKIRKRLNSNNSISL
jgi:transcription factor IIIB subunit 2